jgi:hypothetical protein
MIADEKRDIGEGWFKIEGPNPLLCVSYYKIKLKK